MLAYRLALSNCISFGWFDELEALIAVTHLSLVADVALFCKLDLRAIDKALAIKLANQIPRGTQTSRSIGSAAREKTGVVFGRPLEKAGTKALYLAVP